MPLPRWTPIEAAYHLGEAYAAQHGEVDRDTDPVTLEELARAPNTWRPPGRPGARR